MTSEDRAQLDRLAAGDDDLAVIARGLLELLDDKARDDAATEQVAAAFRRQPPA